jgi:hypothetical protein
MTDYFSSLVLRRPISNILRPVDFNYLPLTLLSWSKLLLVFSRRPTKNRMSYGVGVIVLHHSNSSVFYNH